MFADDFLILPFDPRGDNPTNDIKNEEHVLDKTCPWLIPNGSPFTADSIMIKDVNGQILTEGFEELFKPMPLIEMCNGLDMNMFVYLSEDVLNAYDKLIISYHSTGIRYFPASDAADQLYDIIHGKDPISWNKVIQRPDLYPPKLHWHGSEDLLDWQDLVLYAQYLTGVYQKNSNNMPTWDVASGKINAAMDLLIAQKNIINLKQVNHGQNYSNPHLTTAADLLLGNLDNFATATLTDELAGTSSTLFSTPAGGVAVIQAVSPDTSNIVKNGTFPMSMMGSNDYLPPLIDGSFEGLGTDMNTAAMCLENNDRLVFIARRFDGRVKALYYSYIDDYRSSVSDTVFTGVRYTNPALTLAGYNLDTVLSGSGPGIIVVGDSVKGKWFGALTNGTLNNNTHSFTEFDLSNIVGNSFTVSTFMTVFVTKTYIFIAGIALDGASNDNNIYFYRALRSDLTTKSVVTFTALPVTFKDLSGNQYTNSAYWTPDTNSNNTTGGIKRYLHNISPYATSIQKRYNQPIFTVEETDDVMLIKSVYRPLYTKTDAGTNWFKYVTFEITVRLTAATGAITTVINTPVGTLNALDGLAGSNEWVTSSFANVMSGINWGPYGGIVTKYGDFISLIDNGDHVYVPTGIVRLAGSSQGAIAAMKVLTTNTTLSLYNWTYSAQSIPLIAPLNIGGFPGIPAFDTDGEFLPGLDINSVNRVMGYRKVTGDFAIRSGITNLKLANLYSRPLVNTVYLTSLTATYPIAAYSGTAAELTAAGVQCGTANLATMMLSFDGTNWSNRAAATDTIPAVIGTYLTCARTYTKTYNDDTMSMVITPTSYYGLTQAALNQIRALLTVGTGNSAISIGIRLTIPPVDVSNTGLIANLPIIAHCTWYSAFDAQAMLSTALALTMTITAQPGNVYALTNPVLLDSSMLDTSNIAAQNDRTFRANNTGSNNNFQAYKDGVNYRINCSQGMLFNVPGGSGMYYADLTFNTTTKKFTASNVYQNGYIVVNGIPLIPKVGYGTIYDQSYSGQAAVLVKGSDNNNYLLSSCYPDSGWIIYFKTGSVVTINGTRYSMPIGTVDLRDIEPDPTNKTFYVYASAYGDNAYYIVSGKRIPHNLSIIPVAVVETNATQILTMTRFNTFMLGDAIVTNVRGPGTIPVSTGMPMDEGTFGYIYQSDLPH